MQKITQFQAVLLLIAAIAGFALFSWLCYKLMIYIFKKLQESRS